MYCTRRKEKTVFVEIHFLICKKDFFFQNIEVQHTACIYINNSCEPWYEKIILDRMELHFFILHFPHWNKVNQHLVF